MATKDQEGRYCSIVVRGAMNAAIHHPVWYRRIGAIPGSDADLDSSSELLVTPPLSQFNYGGFKVLCDPERWQIECDLSLLDHACKIATRVFDDTLPETPRRALGINLMAHLRVGFDVAQRLSELVTSLPFGFETSPGSSAKISFSHNHLESKITWRIEPSVRGTDMLFLALNSHKDFDPQTGPPPIGEELERRTGALEPYFAERLNEILGSLGAETS